MSPRTPKPAARAPKEPPARVFSKIKFDGKELELHWSDPARPMVDVEHTLTSKAAPAPDFIDRMRAFVGIVMEILDLPENWEHGENRMSVTGISLSEDKDGRRGLVITARKPILQANNAPLIMNTPYLKEAIDPKEDNQVGFWVKGTDDALRELQRAAQEFVDGKREQTELPLEPEEKLSTVTKEDASDVGGQTEGRGR